MAVTMARRVNPHGRQRRRSHLESVPTEQHSRRAASARERPRRLCQPVMSFEKCAMFVAREPALSGVGVGFGVMHFTPIFCQPVLARNHH